MFLSKESLFSYFADPLRLLARVYYCNEQSIARQYSFDLSKAISQKGFTLNLFIQKLDEPTFNRSRILAFDDYGQPEIQSALSITDHPSISTFATLDAMFRVKKFFDYFEREGKLTGLPHSN